MLITRSWIFRVIRLCGTNWIRHLHLKQLFAPYGITPILCQRLIATAEVWPISVGYTVAWYMTSFGRFHNSLCMLGGLNTLCRKENLPLWKELTCRCCNPVWITLLYCQPNKIHFRAWNHPRLGHLWTEINTACDQNTSVKRHAVSNRSSNNPSRRYSGDLPWPRSVLGHHQDLYPGRLQGIYVLISSSQTMISHLLGLW